jgi:2-hydroxy-3-keto-5-methylthiopentenyl-1-phosphate phosphatase
LDFDGTITTHDVADSILNRFGGLTRRMINSSYDPKVITEEWVRDMFLRVKESPARLRRFIRDTARPRPGFHEFVSRCRELGIAVEIVSGGLDLYLDLLLGDWGHDHLTRYRATSRMTKNGLSVRYGYLKGSTLDDFKRDRVRAHQREGRRVLFAGDGTSDIAAARTADAAYARGHLWKHLRRLGGEAKQLRTFHGPRRLLEKACSRR